MDFKRTGPETAQITARNGTRILFSYGEPVAVFFPNVGTYWRTDRYVSNTTERHIKEFTAGERAARISPEKIRQLTQAVG